MRKVVFMFLLLPILGIAQNWEQIIIASGSDSSNPMFLTELNGELYFSARGSNISGIGNELYKSNGTQEGTTLVMNLNPNFSAGSFPSNFTVFNGELYFTADDGVHGRELFKTNGTTISLVKDIKTGNDSSTSLSDNSLVFHELNGFLYFFAEDINGQGADLWKTDGTSAGTVKVLELNTNEITGKLQYFKKLNTDLYFQLIDSSGHKQIIKYDTVSNVPTTVLNVYPIGNTGFYNYLTIFDNKLFTFANGRIYYTDGINSNFVTLGVTGISSFNKFTVFNNQLIFLGNSSTFGNQDIYKCYYSVADSAYKVELVYNFNAGGNNFLNPLVGSIVDDGIPYFTALNNKLYIAAREQTSPNGGLVYQIYETDGITTQVTIPVTHSGSPTSRPIYWITANNNKLYFLMSGDNSPEQLWEANPINGNFTQLSSYTGPTTQPRQIFTRPLKSWNNDVYVEGTTTAEGYELWKFGTGTLGVEEVTLEDKIQIYPNPTQDYVKLTIENVEVYQIDIFNAVGQQIKLRIDNKTIYLTSVPAGIYYITILNSLTGKKITQKIIKK